VKIKGDYGIIPILDRIYCTPTDLVLIPPIFIKESLFYCISTILNNAYTIEDFPDPDLPTQAILCPPFKNKVRFLSINS